AGSETSQDYPTALAVDNIGDVLVTGHDTIGNSATVKYSSAGLPLWTNRFKASERSEDWATAIAVDANRNVFVTGSCNPTATNLSDFATVAYSSEGVPLWTNRYSREEPLAWNNDQPTAIVVDREGNVLVAGSSTSSTMDFGYDPFSRGH